MGAPGELCGHDEHKDREEAPQRSLGQCVGRQHAKLDARDCGQPDDRCRRQRTFP